jgi:hypothetical protein
MATDKLTVAIVLDPSLGEGLADVLARYPAWVVDTPANRTFWDAAKPVENSAMFRVTDTQQKLNNLLTALPDIEDHFGPDSYPSRPYRRIRVLGLPLTSDVEKRLRERGFEGFGKMVDGFEADFKRE